jgi:hypothetical protein
MLNFGKAEGQGAKRAQQSKSPGTNPGLPSP